MEHYITLTCLASNLATGTSYIDMMKVLFLSGVKRCLGFGFTSYFYHNKKITKSSLIRSSASFSLHCDYQFLCISQLSELLILGWSYWHSFISYQALVFSGLDITVWSLLKRLLELHVQQQGFKNVFNIPSLPFWKIIMKIWLVIGYH